MRSRSATSSCSPSLFAMRPTFFVACWAAWARPRTSASLLSSCVICAMARRLPAADRGQAPRSAARARARPEHRAGLDARAARVLAGRRLVAVGTDDLHGDGAAARGDDEPVAVDLDDRAGRGAGVALDLLAVEDPDLL